MDPMTTGSPTVSERWLVRVRDRATIGPFPTELIELGIARGKVPPESEVCREGSALWRPLATVPGFLRALSSRGAATARGPTDDDEPTQVGAHAATLPDADDDDEATRVLDALGSDPPPATTTREPFLPQRAPLARTLGAAPPAVPPPPSEAEVPTPRVRLGCGRSSLAEAGGDDEATAILELPPPLVAPPPAAARGAGRAVAPAASRDPVRPPSDADELLDADDDEGDVGGVHVVDDATLGSVRPAAGAPPPASVRPAAGAPPDPSLRSQAPPAGRRRAPHRVDRADELTAPAQRMRVAQDRLTKAVVVLAGGLVATLILLVVLLLVLLLRG